LYPGTGARSAIIQPDQTAPPACVNLGGRSWCSTGFTRSAKIAHFIRVSRRLRSGGGEGGILTPRFGPPTNRKNLTRKSCSAQRTTEAPPFNYVVAAATVHHGSAQDLCSRCTEFSAARLSRPPKAAEVPILSRFVRLERAKGIEPSYAAWEARCLQLPRPARAKFDAVRARDRRRIE
jgi:hypothetical protein